MNKASKNNLDQRIKGSKDQKVRFKKKKRNEQNLRSTLNQILNQTPKQEKQNQENMKYKKKKDPIKDPLKYVDDVFTYAMFLTNDR